MPFNDYPENTSRGFLRRPVYRGSDDNYPIDEWVLVSVMPAKFAGAWTERSRLRPVFIGGFDNFGRLFGSYTDSVGTHGFVATPKVD
jgi:hypothetical protein